MKAIVGVMMLVSVAAAFDPPPVVVDKIFHKLGVFSK